MSMVEDITKDWYTNLIPKLDAATNNNNLKICYTVNKIDDYDFDIIWDKPNDLQTGQDYAGRFQMVLLKQDIRMSLGLILMKIILVGCKCGVSYLFSRRETNGYQDI